MTLFKNESFISHAGLSLPFKIDCDYLSDDDIECLAKLVSTRFSFGSVVSVPSGGDRLAEALVKYCSKIDKTVLIVDDVFTTGASIEKKRKELEDKEDKTSKNIVEYRAVVIFARSNTPWWVYPIFELNPNFR